jgi:hypothetical protein
MKWLRRLFCRQHHYEKTGRCRIMFIFWDEEWACTKCGKKVNRFPHINPNEEKS